VPLPAHVVPDVAITIEDLIVEGDKVVLRCTERGTLTGRQFLGIEPTGQAYAKPGTTVYRVVDGRLAESWGVEDTLAGFDSWVTCPGSSLSPDRLLEAFSPNTGGIPRVNERVPLDGYRSSH
jgi:SnoaL-like polyketide cyclase